MSTPNKEQVKKNKGMLMKRIFFTLFLCLPITLQAENIVTFSKEKAFTMQQRQEHINKALTEILKKEVRFDFVNATLFVENAGCDDYQEILGFLKTAAIAMDKKYESDRVHNAKWQRYGKEMKYAGKIAIRDSLTCPFLN